MLCYLVVCYPAGGSRKPESIPESISAWFGKAQKGWSAKSMMILERTFPLHIDDSFQPPISELLTGLHGFFRKYSQEAMFSKFNWCPEPEEAYGVFLDHLNDAIDGLRVCELGMDFGAESNMPNHEVAMSQTCGGAGDNRAFHCRNSDETDYHHGDSTSATIQPASQHPSFTSHVDEGRPGKRSRTPPPRTPSPRPSKRIKSDRH